MDESTRKTLASKLYEEAEKILLCLYSRWQDEKQYEDIKDYEKPLVDLLSKAQAQAVVMKKRPFGFTCKIGDATYQYSVTGKQYLYKRIA